MTKKFVSPERIQILSQNCGYTLSEILDIIDLDDEPFIPTTNQSRQEVLIQQGYDNTQIQEIYEMDKAY